MLRRVEREGGGAEEIVRIVHNMPLADNGREDEVARTVVALSHQKSPDGAVFAQSLFGFLASESAVVPSEEE